MEVSHYGVDPGEPQPEECDWAGVTFVPKAEEHPSPALQALMGALETTGSWYRVAVATFTVLGLTPAMSKWMQDRLPDDLFPYASRLLRESALTKALPELAPTVPSRFADPSFDRLHPLLLAGSIASVVASGGGAYSDGPSMASALAITQRWLFELVGDRYEDLRVAETEGAWTDWFYDVLPRWDRTWLITDVGRQRATLLCITDTD